MKLAAIDIGTNAVRLLVGEVVTNRTSVYIQKYCYTRIPLRLGEEVFENGLISEQKLEDFLKVMQSFKLISDVFKVRQTRVCATSAMREAKNADKVRAAIEIYADLSVEVISGKEEAQLIFSSFPLLLSENQSPYIVIDVGGGSTEVSVFENGERIAAKSFEVGTLRMIKDKTSKTVWKKISDWLAEKVDSTVKHEVFATGGNINKAHKILGARHMEPIKVSKIKKLRSDLNKATIQERIVDYQLKPDRADLIVPALDIYLFILKQMKSKQVIVPKIGLADGMIYDMHFKHLQSEK